MGVSQRPYKSSRVIRLDWMLVTVGLMALALLAASLIRTVPSYAMTEFGTKIGGLRALSDSERLIVFEDHTSGADPDWSGGQRDDTQIGLGAVWLATPADAPLTRRITLPPGTQRSIVTLDLIAIDAWALERLEVSVDGTPALRQSFSSEPDLITAQRTEVLDHQGVVLQSRLSAARELGFERGPGREETRLTVEMSITTSAPELRLSIVPLPAADPAGDATTPAWAIDKLMVIAAER